MTFVTILGSLRNQGQEGVTRQRRHHVPGGIYHVTLRGNHRRRIFLLSDDYRMLEDLLDGVARDYQLTAHAFCWMPNHIHLAVEVADRPLARPMQKLASMFARRVQARLLTTGHLFERRYHAVLVDSERYLFALVRYIHLNPVRAALVPTAGDYRFSSHAAYLGAPHPDWLTTSRVLRQLASRAASARRAYLRLMQVTPPEEELDYLRHGPRRCHSALDERVADDVQAIRRLPQPPTLEELIGEECAREGLTPPALLSPGKHRIQVIVRARITQRATRLGLATLGDLSAALGRSTSSLSEGLRRLQECGPGEFLP